MTLKVLWLGMALMLCNEGLSLTISPKRWRAMVERLCAQSDHGLRRVGFIVGIIAVVMAVMWRLFPQVFGEVWLGFAVMLLLEGLFIGAIPNHWREKMAYMIRQSDQVLRRIGITMLVSGFFIWVMTLLGK